MSTRSFSEELASARQHKYAVGAFNIFDFLSAQAVITAAEKLGCPVILQTSTSTVKKFTPKALGRMLCRLAEDASVNVMIHLDHCREVQLAKDCVDAGWTSVMFDGSHLPVEENASLCREVADYAHRFGVQVEGEIGKISGVEDEIQVEEGDASDAGLDEVLAFIEKSGVDAIAPAIGTAHGIYKGTPHIHFELVENLAQKTDTPIVIHGGTGLSEETFRRLVRGGASKVNVSTALKHAYVDAAAAYLQENPGKYDPLAFDRQLEEAIEQTAHDHMVIFRKDMQ